MQIHLIHHATVDSTNTWAKNHLTTFPQKALVVVSTDDQTAGRGRFKRVWVSPPHTNLALSYCLPLALLKHPPATAPLLLALSARAVLEPLGFQTHIKWPNDLLLQGKKCAGILTETFDGWMVIGIGLNVNMPPRALEQIDRPASSLHSVSGQIFSLSALQQSLTENFHQALQAPFPPFHHTLWAKPGDLLTFHNFKTTRQVRFLAMQMDGSLLVEIEGVPQTLLSGEFI